MGTSTKYPGPTGQGYLGARVGLTRLAGRFGDGDEDPSREDNLDDEQTVAEPVLDGSACASVDRAARSIGEHLRRGLKTDVQADPAVFGLRPALVDRATALVDVLEALHERGLLALDMPVATTTEDREVAFIAAFTDRVAGPTGTLADSALRVSATRCADEMLRQDKPLRDAVRSGDSSHQISRELFCTIYAFFFADTVTEFLTSVVAEHIKIAVPLLYLDPTGRVADYLATKLVGLIPKPCEEQTKAVDRTISLADKARELTGGAISQVLGLDTGMAEAA